MLIIGLGPERHFRDTKYHWHNQKNEEEETDSQRKFCFFVLLSCQEPSDNELPMVLRQWLSKCGSQTRSISITRELVRNINSQALLQTH